MDLVTREVTRCCPNTFSSKLSSSLETLGLSQGGPQHSLNWHTTTSMLDQRAERTIPPPTARPALKGSRVSQEKGRRRMMARNGRGVHIISYWECFG